MSTKPALPIILDAAIDAARARAQTKKGGAW